MMQQPEGTPRDASKCLHASKVPALVLETVSTASLRSAANADFDGLPWQQPAQGPPVSSRHTVQALSSSRRQNRKV